MQSKLVTAGLIGLVIGAVTFTGWSTLSAQPQAAAASKVACVDVVMIFNDYERQRDLTTEMTELQTKLEAENDARRSRIEAMQTAMTQMQPDDPAFAAKRTELMKMQIEYRNWADYKQAQMAREVAVWSTRVYQEIIDATGEVAERQGFDIVLYTDQFVPTLDNPDAVREQIRQRKVLYSSPRVNLSNLVLERLNEKYRAEPKQRMMSIEIGQG